MTYTWPRLDALANILPSALQGVRRPVAEVPPEVLTACECHDLDGGALGVRT